MSPVAEITLTQMQIMHDVHTYMPNFMMGLPREDDDQETKDKLAITNSEVEQLVILGFLEDITSQFTSMMAELELKSMRRHRIFRITTVGRKFFDASASQLVN